MKTQRTLVRDLIPLVAPKVLDSGVSVCSEEGRRIVVENMNLACQDMHRRLDSEGTLFEWYSDANQGCFALPQECREARQIGINGLPLRQRSEFYIGKVATGQCFDGCGVWECRDLGDFYIPQYLPKRRGIRIALVAFDDADAGKVVVIEVTNEHGVPVKEELTLVGGGNPVIMTSVAYDVTYFKKPKTQGVVSLQLHYDDGQRFYFCNYNPDTEEGLFRRKQLPQRFWGCNIVRILGKTRYVQITSEDQIVPYNDPLAVGDACAAIAAWRRNDTEQYTVLMTSALEKLKAQMRDADSASNVKQITVRTNFGNPSFAGNHRRWS